MSLSVIKPKQNLTVITPHARLTVIRPPAGTQVELRQVAKALTVINVASRGRDGVPGPAGEPATGVHQVSLEAGEDMVKGDPVYPSANKFFKASHLGNGGITGLIKANVSQGFIATAITAGEMDLDGLVSGTRYFLGDGSLSFMPPNSGRVQEVGRALTSTKFLVDIKQDFLLA